MTFLLRSVDGIVAVEDHSMVEYGHLSFRFVSFRGNT